MWKCQKITQLKLVQGLGRCELSKSVTSFLAHRVVGTWDGQIRRNNRHFNYTEIETEITCIKDRQWLSNVTDFYWPNILGGLDSGPWDQLGILVPSFLLAYSDKNWELTSRFPGPYTVPLPPKHCWNQVYYGSCKRDTARICWRPSCDGAVAAGRHRCRSIFPTRGVLSSKPAARCYTGPLHRPCSAYCASDVNNQPLVEISKRNCYQQIRKNRPSHRVGSRIKITLDRSVTC